MAAANLPEVAKTAIDGEAMSESTRRADRGVGRSAIRKGH